MAKKIDETNLFDDIEEEMEEIEDDEEEIIENEYDNLDPEKYYFHIIDDDGCLSVEFVPIDYYEENQSTFDGKLEIDSIPDHYSELLPCIFESELSLSQEDIIDELLEVGFVMFPHEESVILTESENEKPHLSSTDELVYDNELDEMPGF
jgi:hypothetical protein